MAPDLSERALQSNRKECYKARDEFFKCMEENKEDEKKCRDTCPESWVGHFIRKNKYEYYKKKLDEEGMPAVDEKYFTS
ncbi:PRORP domain-containing protein [Aphelenchoides bicaudatus]|nr:PRORP domain-containing protein [Aphelenchoides bicaudatus]